jgi:hypothetical protein
MVVVWTKSYMLITDLLLGRGLLSIINLNFFDKARGMTTCYSHLTIDSLLSFQPWVPTSCQRHPCVQWMFYRLG